MFYDSTKQNHQVKGIGRYQRGRHKSLSQEKRQNHGQQNKTKDKRRTQAATLKIYKLE